MEVIGMNYGVGVEVKGGNGIEAMGVVFGIEG